MIRKIIAACMIIFFAATIHTTAFAAKEPKVIQATGMYFIEPNCDQRDSFVKTFARQTARMDAIRNLVETIGKIKFEKVNGNPNIIRTRTSHDSKAFQFVAKHARVVDVKFHSDGTCEVTMEVVVPADWKN